MGMTIDEAIKHYEDMKKGLYLVYPETLFDFTIETMRKYQEMQGVLDIIRAEIFDYEGDCRLSIDEYPSCKQCTDNVFKTIYGILDKCKAKSEVDHEQTTGD